MEEITLGVGLAIEIALIIATFLIISSHLRRNSRIDQSFIQECPNDINCNTIVRTIIVMAHLLKLHVKAEGVEKEEQVSFCSDRDVRRHKGIYSVNLFRYLNLNVNSCKNAWTNGSKRFLSHKMN